MGRPSPSRSGRETGGQRGPGPVGGEDRCGLCGRTKGLTRTECCGRPACDAFSTRRSCSRNHSRFTLCGLHHAERHRGEWKSCGKCRRYFSELELYVYFGTNKYNFEKLKNPPAYEPTHCGACGRVIRLAEDGYSVGPEGYRCEPCFEEEFEKEE